MYQSGGGYLFPALRSQKRRTGFSEHEFEFLHPPRRYLLQLDIDSDVELFVCSLFVNGMTHLISLLTGQWLCWTP